MFLSGFREVKIFSFFGSGLKKSLTSWKFKKKKFSPKCSKKYQKHLFGPQKGFLWCFWHFLDILFFRPFLAIFTVFYGDFVTMGMKVIKNGVDKLKKHVWDRFLGVFDHIRPFWSGFGSFWREIKFVIFWPFLLCFLVKRGPSWGRKTIKSHPKWLFFHSLDVFLMFLVF